MSCNLPSVNSSNQPLPKFLEIYEKMLKVSRNLAVKTADAHKRDKKKRKDSGQVS